MVGGIVIGIEKSADEIKVIVRDTTYPKDACAIRLVRNAEAERVALEDQIWWQSDSAYWTATGGARDVRIPRNGFSWSVNV